MSRKYESYQRILPTYLDCDDNQSLHTAQFGQGSYRSNMFYPYEDHYCEEVKLNHRDDVKQQEQLKKEDQIQGSIG